MWITNRKIPVLLVISLFVMTSVSWAYGQVLRLQIQVNSKTLPNGNSAEVIPMSNEIAFTVKKGSPHKEVGLELFKIKLADSSFSELAQIYLTVESKRKNNWWVKAGLYYQIDPDDVNSTDEDTDKVLFLDGGKLVKRFSGEIAEEHLLTEDADGLLMTGGLFPEDAVDKENLYIIGSYMNNGGNPAKGQQDNLNKLQFHCMVRM